jgi:hypothetical protein
MESPNKKMGNNLMWDTLAYVMNRPKRELINKRRALLNTASKPFSKHEAYICLLMHCWCFITDFCCQDALITAAIRQTAPQGLKKGFWTNLSQEVNDLHQTTRSSAATRLAAKPKPKPKSKSRRKSRTGARDDDDEEEEEEEDMDEDAVLVAGPGEDSDEEFDLDATEDVLLTGRSNDSVRQRGQLLMFRAAMEELEKEKGKGNRDMEQARTATAARKQKKIASEDSVAESEADALLQFESRKNQTWDAKMVRITSI